MTTLKRRSDGNVSRSGEKKIERFETSPPKDVEEDIANLIKILKDMSKMFHQTTSNEIKRLAFEVAQEKVIVTKCIQENEMAGLRCLAIFLSERIFP